MLRVAKKVVILTDSNRFGQGPILLRLIKLALWKTRLWGAFNYLRTAGKGYQITEGDGLSYSYSIYDSFEQIVRWADRLIVIPSDKVKPSTWLHPLLTSPRHNPMRVAIAERSEDVLPALCMHSKSTKY